MARLPTAEDLGSRPTPRGGGGISKLRLSAPRRGAEAQAEIEFGRVIEGIGDTLGVLAAKEKAKVGEARAEQGYSTYQDSLLELQANPQTGFVNLRGEQAINPKLVEQYRTQREGIRNQIRQKLDDNDQRTAFDNRARIADRQFDARLYAHISEQTQVYQGQVSEGVFATEGRAAALNYAIPGQIEMSLARVDHEIERNARIKGITDQGIINQQKLAAGSSIHANVISQMLVTGKDSAALAYYNGVKEELTPDAMVKLGGQVQAAAIDGEAVRSADVVWSVLGPKDLNDPVRLDVMEAWIRDKHKDNPQVVDSAIKDLRSRAIASRDAQAEMRATSVADVLQEFHDGADLATLQTMPAYQALDGKSKTEVRDYVLQRGRSEQQHARSEAQYREGLKSAAAYSTYWELSNPNVLSGMSEKQILAMEPMLGQKIMGDLIEAKRKMTDPARVRAATIDAELFNVVAADAGLKPYEKNNTPEQREYLGRLKNNVEAAIATAQAGGKDLSRDEKETLMRSMVDKKVMVSDWGKDTSLPAPVIKPELRSKVYVPIEAIDAGWLKGAANFMRSNGYAPMDWDDAKIKRNMKGRLERAYAISITGGSADEGKKALEGKEE